MIWIIPALGLLVVVGLIVWQFREPLPPPTPPDPERLQKAAIELHRIRRRREGAELRHQQRQGAVRVKREIAEALESDRQ